MYNVRQERFNQEGDFSDPEAFRPKKQQAGFQADMAGRPGPPRSQKALFWDPLAWPVFTRVTGVKRGVNGLQGWEGRREDFSF